MKASNLELLRNSLLPTNRRYSSFCFLLCKPTLVSIRKQVISLQSATKTDETVVPRHLKVPEHINGGSLLCQRGSLIGCKAFAYPSMVCQLLANELSKTSLVGRMCPNCTDHVYAALVAFLGDKISFELFGRGGGTTKHGDRKSMSLKSNTQFAQLPPTQSFCPYLEACPQEQASIHFLHALQCPSFSPQENVETLLFR